MKIESIEVYVNQVENTGFEMAQEGGCGCSCSSDCGDDGVAYTPVTLQAEMQELHGQDLSFVVENVADQEAGLVQDKLNAIFKFSGERLQLTDANMAFAMSQVLPMVVVNGKIASVKALPTAAQLNDAIHKGERVKAAAGCC